VAPNTYCNDGAKACHDVSVALPKITAHFLSRILVDVPKEVADNHWIVTAYTVDAKGKRVTVPGADSPLLHGRHSVWLPVTSSEDYYLQIGDFDGADRVGTWTVQVHVTA